MKKISRKEIEKIVKNEYKAGRQFCDYDRRRYYKLMIDTSDGNIWSDVFLDENSWKEYDSDAIQQLSYGERSIYNAFGVKEKEQGYIKDAVSTLERAGWEIAD